MKVELVTKSTISKIVDDKIKKEFRDIYKVINTINSKLYAMEETLIAIQHKLITK